MGRWPLLLAVLVIAGLVFAFWLRAAAVDAGEVLPGSMVASVTDTTVTRAQEHYIVSAPVTGYLARIQLEAGDQVSAGQKLARISSRPSTPLDPHTLAEGRAALASAQAAATPALR
jgi:HlyD family secretion protein